MRTAPQLFFCTLGLCFVLEGVLWTLFPDTMRRIMREFLAKPPEMLRCYGLVGLALGLLLVALFR